MGTRKVSLAEHNFRVYQQNAVKEDPTVKSVFIPTHTKVKVKEAGSNTEGYQYYYHKADFMIEIGAAFAEGLFRLINGQDDDGKVDPYTTQEAMDDFERLEENKHNKIVIIFGCLLMGSIIAFAVKQNGGSTRGICTGAGFRVGVTSTINAIRPIVRAVIPTDDEGNLVLGVVVVPTNAVADVARSSYEYADSTARSTIAYARASVRSVRLPEVQLVVRSGQPADDDNTAQSDAMGASQKLK